MADTPASAPSTPAVAPATPAAPAQTPASTPNAQASGTPAAPAAVVEQVIDAKEVLSDPNASKTQKKAAEKTLRKLMIKVDGEEFEETLPFDIPNDPKSIEYTKKQLQLARMAQKRGQEKSNLEKEVGQLINDIKKDPWKVLSDPAIGLDVKDEVRKFIEKEIENSKKSPEQLELEQIREELRIEKERQANEKKLQEENDRKTKQEQYEREYDEQISKALETNQIPKSPAAIKKIIDYMQLALEMGKEVSVGDVVPFVRDELINDYREHAKNLPDDALEEFFGKDTIDRIRKVSVARAKKANSNPALKAPTKVAETGKSDAQPKKEEQKISYRDFFKKF